MTTFCCNAGMNKETLQPMLVPRRGFQADDGTETTELLRHGPSLQSKWATAFKERPANNNI